MIDTQCGRRNLPDIDCIALQRRREGILAKQASKIKSEKIADSNRRRAGKPTVGKIANNEKPDTRKESAKAAGMGERTYDAGKLILWKLCGELPAGGLLVAYT